MRSAEKLVELVKANRIKQDYLYALADSKKLALYVITFAGIVWFLSKDSVNRYEHYGYFTALQGFEIAVLFWFARAGKKTKSMLIAACVLYISLWILEYILLGFPGDLYEGYNGHHVNTPGRYATQSYATARVFGFVYPVLYQLFKLVFGWIVYRTYLRCKKYQDLPDRIHKELEHWR